MGKQIDENFVKTYSDQQYQHTAMVNHRGTVVSFAMDDQRRIYYAVLDISQEDKNKGPLDVKYWVDNPQLLSFPAEIEQVGFAVVNPVQMPTVKKDTRLEASATTTVSPSEADAFLSTTARLTADAPFQVFSDNQHIYVFRQSLAGNHADMVYKLKSGGSSGTETDLTKFVTDQKVPLVTETLLVDRFILAGTELKLPREVRFRRSENRTSPASAKDSLGAKDMEGNAFSETTKELDFIRNLSGGCFSVILLPTQVADIERWQLFAYNKATKLIDSFNIERSDDGFFNTQGTQLYTSPDERYKASVLERKPGKCPFTALPLVPNVSKSGYAEWALNFIRSAAHHVSMGNPTALQITGDQTIEMWIKPTVLGTRQNPFNKAYGGEGAITLEGDGTINYYYGTSGRSARPFQQLMTTTNISAGSWVHIAIVRDLSNPQGGTLRWYINGVASGSATATYAAAKKSAEPVLIGKGYAGNFEGLIDEVRIWNRARSGSEIKETMNHRLIGDELGLAGYWRFDEAAGTQVKDLTRNGNHGTLSSDGVKWVASDAPIGEYPGMQRTSFAFGDREVDTGLAARLYYQQEKESSETNAKSVKQNARVLLTAVTSGSSATDRKYVAAVDFGVSRAGKLAQMPDIVPLPLLSADSGGVDSDAVLSEISGLETDVPRLETEIVELNRDITALNQSIRSDEDKVATLSVINTNIQQLENNLRHEKRVRTARFYQHSGQRGWMYSVSSDDGLRPNVGSSYNDSFSSYSLDTGLKVTVYEHQNYGGRHWVLHTGEGYGWNDEITSVKVLLSDAVQANITALDTSLSSKKSERMVIENIRDTLLPPQKTQKTQKNTLLQTKQGEPNQKNPRLTELRKIRIGTPPSQPMPMLHTDPRGLTVSSGLLGFAYTDSQPYLFESALGRMAIYFKGANKQFFSAYYDVNTARARWSLAVGSGSLTLVSRATDSQVNDTAIVVANGTDADHCKVTIQNANTGLTETWNDIPREASAFAQVLNGEAGEKVFVGKLKTSLTGAAITSIDLKDGLPREVPAGSTLWVEDSSSGSKQTSRLIIAAKAASGAKQITITSATPTLAADAKVYLFLFDYASKASSNRSGYTLDNGNLQVDVVVGSATGNVANATASRTTEAQSPQWTADAPGSALYFDGTNDYLPGTPPNNFEHEGDITLEAWARPLDFTDDIRLIHCKSGASHYSLGLRQTPVNSALSLDGSGDYVTLPAASKLGLTNHDFTVEAWVKVNSAATGTDQAILGSDSGGVSKRLHLIIRNNKPYLGFFGNDLADPTVLTKGTWYHLAFRYTAATKQQVIFVNGDKTSHRTASAHYSGTGNLNIGRWSNYYLDGAIDEVRIWNIARDATDIKANMSRRLGGQEPGLTAYYHFELGNADDRSGNGHHGALQGNLTSRAPVASPLKAYTCFASVGSDAIATIDPIVSHSWHHYAAVYNQSYALKFDSNDFGDAGNESMLNITEDLTIEAFVKLDSLGRNHGIVSKGIMDNGGEGSVPYAFYIDKTGKLVLAFEDEDGTNHSYSSSSSVTAGAFKRVAVVRKIGREKIEKTGTTAIKYTDSAGVEKTKNVKTIESIDFKENSDVRFYIDSADAGTHKHTGKKPIGNNGSLYIGQSYIANQERTQFQGTISEIRIWNVARPVADVNTNLTGSESGLTAWWRFEENTGNIAYDAKGGNHARISGAQWVKNPDPKGSSFVIYRDGQQAAKTNITRPGMGSTAQLMLGALKQNSGHAGDLFKGNLEEVRIWKTARRREEILDNLFTRLKGEKKDLIANYSFDDITSTQVKDGGLKGNHLTFSAATEQQPTQVLSTAPISNDTAQVRSALAGIKTDFHAQISGRPAAAEYADMQRLEDGSLIGVHKRCYAYTKDGKWLLLTGYKVGNLITEWIGQAQFDPQVIGYIEGAPPVPSENLTEGYYSTSRTFNGSSEVTVNESENVNYSVSTSKQSGFSSGFEGEANLGLKFDPRIVMAPLGIGISKKVKFSFQSTFNLSMEANGAWSSGESFGSGQNISRKLSAAIGGNWDVADKTQWVNPDLTRRFIPVNMGFAFVESETADIYALRLEHNGALVAFRMLPNPDIPKDTNIIPFPINNRYSKQGTLDGRIGYTSTGIALDPDYANATGYGEYSYFKPKEAYELKKRIEREAQRLKDYYDNFNSTPAGTQLMGGLAGGIGGGSGGVAALGTTAAAALGAGPAIAPVLSVAMIAGGMGTTIGSLIDATTSKDEDLPNKFARRNIANTYVWTADGGFYEESTQISEVSSESKSGSYSFSGTFTGGFALEVETATKSDFGLKGMLGGSLNLTKSKSEEAKNSFSISMKLLVPDNLQQYVYKKQIDDPNNSSQKLDDTSSGVKPIYDNKGNPVKQPGKVDAFRFMTFHLEPGLNNFEDLFGKVIDPIWLEESQHPNAMALRQANQAVKKPKCWRVFHRVTFVSRILPDFPSATAPSLETKMKDLNIASNYELVRRLEPFVRDHTANFTQFQDAVKAAVQAYLPELSAEKELNQITLFLADYYGVSY